jgi:hypothetical protein
MPNLSVEIGDTCLSEHYIFTTAFVIELRLSSRWVRGNIGSTDATKTCHTLNVYIFETNNHKVSYNTSLDSL